MMKAFNAIGVEGAGDTGQLSVGIGEVLVSTAVGLALFVPGVILLTISIIHYGRAKRTALPPQVPTR